MTSHQAIGWTDAEAFAQSLPRYELHGLALHNRLHTPRRSWHGQFAGQAFAVQWNSGTPVAVTGVEAWLTFAEAVLMLRLPAEAVQALQLPASLALDSLAGSLLLEQALLALIVPLEQLTGQPIRLLDSPPGTASCALVMQLSVQLADAAEWPVQLHMNVDGAMLLAEMLDRHVAVAPQDLGHVRVPLTVESGEAWLSLAELRSLLPGDVVMLEPWPGSQVRLCMGHALQAGAQLEGNRLQLIEAPMAMNSLKEQHMSETGTEPSLVASLDELQLKLVCQVGSVELSLAQLRELGAGSLLQLTPQMHEGVELLINGRRVGHGQLVQIGEGLGVRLLSFATP